MKKVAVMQPYFFPYLGYFQLVHAVDEFIFLDDVTFIKGGHINRNSILLNGRAHRFAVPVANISSNRAIREHQYIDQFAKFFDLLRRAYVKAPHFKQVFDLVGSVVAGGDKSVAAVNAESIMSCARYLGLHKSFDFSSTLDPDPSLGGASRVMHLCEKRRASIYINSPGGRSLYDPKDFAARGLRLGFIAPAFPEYQHEAAQFVPGLSMIDVLMWNSPDRVVDMLGCSSFDYPDRQTVEGE